MSKSFAAAPPQAKPDTAATAGPGTTTRSSFEQENQQERESSWFGSSSWRSGTSSGDDRPDHASRWPDPSKHWQPPPFEAPPSEGVRYLMPAFEDVGIMQRSVEGLPRLQMQPAQSVAGQERTAKAPRADRAPALAAAAAEAAAAEAEPRPGADPAQVVEWMRAGPRASLPHREQVESRLRMPLPALEVYGGERAQRASAHFGASAFAAGNVVAFAESTPPLSRVIHEVSHVVQQGVHRSALGRFAPGSLELSDPSSAPEQEAEATARGEALPRSSSASMQIYRATSANAPAPKTPKSKIQVYLEHLLKAHGLETFAPSDAVFSFSQNSNTPIVKFQLSSKKPWQRQDITNSIKGNGVAKNPETEANKVTAAIRNGGTKQFRFSHTKGIVRVSRVGKGASKSYAFIGKPSEASHLNLYDYVTWHERKISRTPTQKLIDYNGFVKGLKGFDIDMKNTEKLFKTKESGAEELVDIVDPSEDQLANIRHSLTEEVVLRYWTKLKLKISNEAVPPEQALNAVRKDVHKAVVESNIFAGYPSIQGGIFEAWDAKSKMEIYKSQGTVVHGSQIHFPKKIGSTDFNGRADGLLVESGKHYFLEGKAYGATGPEAAKGQMDDYQKLIGKDVLVRYDDSGKNVEKKIRLASIRYSVSSEKQAPEWKCVLEEMFEGKGYELSPDADCPGKESDDKDGPGKESISISQNPLHMFPIENAEGKEPKVVAPLKGHAGIVIDKVSIDLAKSGLSNRDYNFRKKQAPYIKNGSFIHKYRMMNGAFQSLKGTEARVIKNTNFNPSKAVAKDNAHGYVKNEKGSKSQGVKSALDKFLKNVKTEAALTDEGVEATLSLANEVNSGIPGIKLSKARLTAGWTENGGTLTGSIGFRHESDKFKGNFTASWSDDKLTLKGDATVENLIPGLEPLTSTATYTVDKDGRESFAFGIKEVTYKTTIGGVDLTGTVESLAYKYNDEQSDFEGNVELSGDLRALGTVKASAAIKNSKLDEAALTYESKTIALPPGKDKPALTAKLASALVYKDDKISGSITGTAVISAPALKKLSKDLDSIGLQAQFNIGEDGNFSGSIETQDNIPLGKHFAIPKFKATLDEKRQISASFAVEVVNIPNLEKASMACTIDGEGFHIAKVDIDVPLGTKNKGRMWGALKASYDNGDIKLGAEAWVKIKEGMVAHGELEYDSAKETISANDLEIGRIQLLEYGSKTHELFAIGPKQIQLLYLSVLGIYADVGFNMSFDYNMSLWAEPSVSLEGLSLDTLEFEKAQAKIQLGGELAANLTGTPRFGLGVFALHPKLLRGGGGIEVPVTAGASLKPDAIVDITYTPEGDVEGDGAVDLVLSFGVHGEVRPFAELSVLDGAYESTWEGDALAAFTLLPERDLYTYHLDFGKPLQKETEPAIPSKSVAATKSGGQKRIESKPQGKKPAAKESADASKTPPTAAAAEKPGNDNGFDLGGMIKSLLDQPNFASIDDVLSAAGEVWDMIKNSFGRVVKLVQNWMAGAGDALTETLRGIKEHKGLFSYLSVVLEKKMSPELYEIVSPLFEAIGESEGKLWNLLEKPLPQSASAFVGWVFELFDLLLDLGWSSLTGLVTSLGRALAKAGSLGAGVKQSLAKYANLWVQQGQLGVKRKRFSWMIGDDSLGVYQYKIRIGGLDITDKQGWLPDIDKLVGTGLWELLESLDEVKPTNTRTDEKVGEPYNDYWVGPDVD